MLQARGYAYFICCQDISVYPSLLEVFIAMSHQHPVICTVPRIEARSQGQDAGGIKIVVVIGSPSLHKV